MTLFGAPFWTPFGRPDPKRQSQLPHGLRSSLTPSNKQVPKQALLGASWTPPYAQIGPFPLGLPRGGPPEVPKKRSQKGHFGAQNRPKTGPFWDPLLEGSGQAHMSPIGGSGLQEAQKGSQMGHSRAPGGPRGPYGPVWGVWRAHMGLSGGVWEGPGRPVLGLFWTPFWAPFGPPAQTPLL